ncbi:MAG: thioredoxin-disulfide reductase [Rickettsiaceae bacterium]|nr:thioredoxin-disulfide reductase [Rickettsiaceae bacterium]MDP4832803.1 thioredoxin-disulfide reductase [Rickettsiaceae bacterium]MDP5021327.1 thioredoxin-disulfide reductase [Rickettsiaceae bacterium]MDP5083331.1 thioredoxin-disulfide reductase [Rickettsiaceae bacterium]
MTNSPIKTKVLIIGSGPAGLSAAIYAARASLEPILIHGMQPGGQLTITTDVENYPGFAETIQGPWLMQEMEKQAEHVGANLVHDYVEKVELSKRPFKAYTSSGDIYEADSLIISTGAQAKWLGLPTETEFQGFGVSGCATCDGFFYKGKEVVVIGGGNTAVEEALYLTNHASKVHVVHRKNTFRAEQILQKRLFANSKISVIWEHVLEEVVGTQNPKSVNGVRLKSIKTGNITDLACDGVFVAIGHKPNTDMFKGQLKMDTEGYIITAPDSTATNIAGVYAAGDVQDKIYRQAVTAAGTGCMAALEADKFLRDV